MLKSSLALSLSLALAATTSLRADFSGAYSVGASATYNLVSGASATAVGEWDASATFTGTGSSSKVVTTSAPGSIQISATGGANTGVSNTYFSFDSFTTAGAVSFSFALSGAGGSFTVLLDEVAQSALASTYSFTVTPGQVLKFHVNGTGTAPTIDLFGGTGTTGTRTRTVTISNFVAPSAIPEPSSSAALAGVAFLGLALSRRRARRA